MTRKKRSSYTKSFCVEVLRQKLERLGRIPKTVQEENSS
jgi:hypothetical protein